MNETWVAGPKRRQKHERYRRPRDIDWTWIALFVIVMAVGIAMLWFAIQLMEGL